MESDSLVSNGDMRWLDRAFKVAHAVHDTGAYRLAAVAIKGGSLLAVGVNRHRNNPLFLTDIPRDAWSTHAEEACIRQLSKPANCTLYVARATPGGRTALAKPCPACQILAFEAGINKIVYTTKDGAGILRLREDAYFQVA